MLKLSSHKHRIILGAIAVVAITGLSVPLVHAQDTIPKFPTAPKARISKEFPISYWNPPTYKFHTLERYQEIVEAGMTFHMAETENRRPPKIILNLLDMAQKTGQKMFINDPRMPRKITGEPGAEAAIDSVLKDYKNHPGLAGYYLYDEPKASMFAGLGEVAAYLRKHDPEHPAYINLYPTYAPLPALGTSSYEEYLREFVKQVQPFVLSYDHYSLVNAEQEGEEFFLNLAIARKVAQEAGIPFWQCLQVVQWGTRNLNEAELRYEAMQTLAYGGKGIIWFTYWLTQEVNTIFKQSMIDADGKRNPHYDMVKRVNAEVRAIGNQLIQADSIAVFHSGKVPSGASGRAPGMPVDVTGPGNLTVGLFRRGQNENLTLVANTDHKQAIQTEVMIFSGSRLPRVFNITTKKWEQADVKAKTGGFSVSLNLGAGSAALLQW